MIMNGSRVTVTAKITVLSPSPNQMMASRVQPMPGNELRNGVRRESIAGRSQPT